MGFAKGSIRRLGRSGAVAAACFAGAALGLAHPQDEGGGPRLDWTSGPATGALGEVAEIAVPEGYAFAGAADTKKLLTLMENPTSGRELGTVSPQAEDESWLVFFEYDDSGYVEDDNAELDADALLDSIREGNDAANDERRRRGWTTIDITGWQQAPRYNEQNHRLEWAIRGRSEGHDVVNWNTRLLGRRGVMEVSLVGDPQGIEAALPAFDSLLQGFSFSEGQRYAQFTSGDKVAKGGLAALVLGGSLAMAAKSGLLAKLWKFLVVGAIAIAGFFRRLFARLTGRSNDPARGA